MGGRSQGAVSLCALLRKFITPFQAIYALDKGEVYHAYELYLSAGLYNPAHDLAVLELAPDAVIHRDLDLLKELFERFIGRPTDDWHIRGKVRYPDVRYAYLSLISRYCADFP